MATDIYRYSLNPIKLHSCMFQHPNNFKYFALGSRCVILFFSSVQKRRTGPGREQLGFRHARGTEAMRALEGNEFTFNPGISETSDKGRTNGHNNNKRTGKKNEGYMN